MNIRGDNKIEGYWGSERNSDYPMPKPNVLSEADAALISMLIELKEQQAKVLRFKGMTTSRINGDMMGSTEFTLDGWNWPVDFRPHYVLEHRVRPTDEFLEFIGFIKPKLGKKIWKDVREIPASGKSNWSGGAYTLAFVYSNKGNFLLKGYFGEIKEYLENLRTKGYRFIVNYSLWHKDEWTGKSKHRDIWSVSSKGTYLSEPDPKCRFKKANKFKWILTRYGIEEGEKTKELTFKRLPKKWIPEYDTIIY